MKQIVHDQCDQDQSDQTQILQDNKVIKIKGNGYNFQKQRI